MNKQTVNFAIVTEKGVVKEMGRAIILQPKTNFKDGTIHWADDSRQFKVKKA